MMQRHPHNDTAVCACEDGSLRLFDLSGERVTYLRSIQMCPLCCMITTRCKVRVVSCAWSSDGSSIVCGTGSSQIYVYNVASSKTESLEVSQSKSEETVVWSVQFLSPSL